MKIEHLKKGVEIIRHQTIAHAFMVNPGSYAAIFAPFVSRVLDEGHSTDAELLREPLTQEYEGERVYERTCALVSLDGETPIHKLYQELAGSGYSPASVSEGLAYLAILVKEAVEVNAVPHLGTFICDREFHERRLLTRRDGKIEFIDFCSLTKLKAHYRIVAVEDTSRGYAMGP
ncbi:MAG: hypothetical protein ACYC1Y_03600 [Minisyncoccota bacterium]